MEEIISQLKQDILYGTHSVEQEKKHRINERDLILASQILNQKTEVIKITAEDLDNRSMLNKKLKTAK